MSASNLFDDLEGDDDIFYTPAKTPPKKKKQWMDDLLDDDKDLFGDIKVDEKETVAVVAAGKEKLEEETEAKKPKSGGGLFDDLPLDDGGDAPLSTNDGQASNSVNGYKDEEFVVVSHDEVPSREETERTANPPPDTDTTEAEHDGPNSDLFNQNIGYEERARLRREQRRKRAEEKEHSSKTPSPTSPPLDDTKQDRDKRSTTPSPSPGIEETTQVFSGSGKAQSPVADPGHVAVEPQVEKADSSTPTPEPPAQQSKDDSNEQIWQLTKSLERAQSENGYLKSENERLSGQVKTLQDKVAQLEKQLADRDKKEDVDNAANKKQVADLQEQLKSKDKEIEELRAVLKKSESPHHASITTVVSGKKTPHSPRTKLRAGVDKGRPITSVAESVKKFGGAGTAEVKRTPAPAKPKQSSPAHVKPDDKHTTAKKPSVPLHPKPSPPSKPRATIHHDKPDAHTSKHSHTHHPHPSAKDHTHHPHPHSHHTPHTHHPHPHKPEPANRSAKVTHKKPHPHHHAHSHATTSDKKESEKQDKKMEEEKKTEVTTTKEEPKPEPEPVAPPADAEPPSEPKPEAPAAEVKPSEKKEEETTIQQLEKDTTRAQRVISMFENKGTNKPEQEQAPSWKVNAQQQRTARDKEEREKEVAKQKEQEQEEKEKPEAEEKSRTSSNASSHKDEPVVVNGSVETTTAESANDEKEVRTPETDGGMITKPKAVAPASSNVTKSTSALPPATKNTSNKNEEIKIRDNKMKKTGSATTIIPDPKKRLMVDEAKGKRTSWAAPKREECAVCGKVVYVMERLEADKVVYHKTCFKCTVCNKTLSTGNYAALQGKTYCKVHFKQLFKMKGNYDEGFGREQHKTKWIKKDGENEA